MKISRFPAGFNATDGRFLRWRVFAFLTKGWLDRSMGIGARFFGPAVLPMRDGSGVRHMKGFWGVPPVCRLPPDRPAPGTFTISCAGRFNTKREDMMSSTANGPTRLQVLEIISFFPSANRCFQREHHGTPGNSRLDPRHAVGACTTSRAGRHQPARNRHSGDRHGTAAGLDGHQADRTVRHHSSQASADSWSALLVDNVSDMVTVAEEEIQSVPEVGATEVQRD